MGTFWTDKRTPAETLRFVQEVSELLSKDLRAGPITSHLNGMMQKGDWLGVVEYEFDYHRPFAVSDLNLARQIHALLHKQSEWLDLGIDREKNAYSKFLAAEERCRSTNAVLGVSAPAGAVSSVLYRASRKITNILGDVPKLSDLSFSFGPGANTSVKGSIASPRVKLGARLACSEELLPVVGDLLAEVPLWTWSHIGSGDLLSLTQAEEIVLFPEIEVHVGKLVFVPKNAKTKRSIVVEPILNGFAQKGIGSYIRDRLLRCVGLDLRDQTRNRELARQGSIDGSLATIDLSSASDTISLSAVSELLPAPWFEFLSNFRTGKVSYGDDLIDQEKFSSMGNAFTFELESLIFFALASAVVDHLGIDSRRVSVFGDDIIVPTEAYHLLEEVLTWCGFEVNTSKSYWTGHFRESCGADWVSGIDVRPFYLRDQISDRTLYTFHNWAIRHCEPSLASLILSWTNPHLRLWGPDGYGDGHLVGSFSLRAPRSVRRSGWGGGYFDTYVDRAKRHKKRYPGDWVFPSYSVYTRSGERDRTDPDIVRGSSGYAKKSIYTFAPTVFRRY